MNNANIYQHMKESIESMLYTSDELISGIKILILDNFTIKLINQIYTQSNLSYLGITLSLSIEKAVKLQQMPNTKAIFLLQNTQENIKHIIQSYQQFNAVYLNFVDNINDSVMEQLASSDKQFKIQSIKVLNCNFIPLLPNFVISNSMLNVYKFLQSTCNIRSVRYQYGNPQCETEAQKLSTICTTNTKYLDQKRMNCEVIYLDNTYFNEITDISFLQLLHDFRNLTTQSEIDTKNGAIPMSFFTSSSLGQKLMLSEPYSILSYSNQIRKEEAQHLQNIQQGKNIALLEQLEQINQDVTQKRNERINISSSIRELTNEILVMLFISNLQQEILSQKLSKLGENDQLKRIIDALIRYQPSDNSWPVIAKQIKILLKISILYCQEKHIKNNQNIVNQFIQDFQKTFNRNQSDIYVNVEKVKEERLQLQQKIEYYQRQKQNADSAILSLQQSKVAQNIDQYDLLQVDNTIEQLYYQLYTLIAIQSLNYTLSEQDFPVTQLTQRGKTYLQDNKALDLVILYIQGKCPFSQSIQLINSSLISSDIQKILRNKVLIISQDIM